MIDLIIKWTDFNVKQNIDELFIEENQVAEEELYDEESEAIEKDNLRALNETEARMYTLGQLR